MRSASGPIPHCAASIHRFAGRTAGWAKEHVPPARGPSEHRTQPPGWRANRLDPSSVYPVKSRPVNLPFEYDNTPGSLHGECTLLVGCYTTYVLQLLAVAFSTYSIQSTAAHTHSYHSHTL